MVAMGGAVHVFKPRSTGEGFGRSWYPPFNSGASAFFALYGGAEMTCQEVRFIPVRFKDAYGPVGAWFLLFKAVATNALGENYMQTNRPELENWAPYGSVKPVPANLRNYLMLMDVEEGKAPIYMRSASEGRHNTDGVAASVGCSGGVTGGHRRRILRIRLLRRAYRPVLAQAHVALKPLVTPTQATPPLIGTLIAVVLAHAPAVRSLGSRWEGLRATWASSGTRTGS